MKMYEVCAKCGHVGRDFYTEKIFAVKAKNAKEAAQFARFIPRVKHHHLDAIRYVHEIDEGRYYEIIETNDNDPYFSCHNIQEQRRIDIAVIPEEKREKSVKTNEENSTNKPMYNGKQIIRNPHKYIRYYATEEAYAI